VGWRKLKQNGICGRQPDLQCGLDLVVLKVLIEANIYFSFSGGFLYSRGGRGWTVLVEDHWVWTSLEWKKTEPNRTEPKLIGLNRFSVRFGSKKNFKKIRFGCLFWFKTGPNRKCSALQSAIKGLKRKRKGKKTKAYPRVNFFFFIKNIKRAKI